MADLAKWMIAGGVLLAVAGAALWGMARIGFRGLPGDLAYRGPHVRVYFPIVTCVVLSILLTLGVRLWQWFSGR